MTTSVRFTLYVFVSALAAAVGMILTEIALRSFGVNAVAIAFLSNLAGGVFLLACARARGPSRWRGWPGADRLRLVAAAATTYGVAMVWLYEAVRLIGSSKTALLGRLEVLFVVALAVVFLGERWSVRHWLASALALGGTVLVSFDPAAWHLQLSWGELLTLLATLAFATGIVILKSLVDRQDGRVVTGLGLVLGAGFITPFLLHRGYAAEADPAAGTAGLAVAALLVVRGVLLGISWVTYNVAMRHLGASRCAVLFLNVVPFTVVLQVAVDAMAPGLGLQVPANLLTASLGGLVIAAGILLLPRRG